MMHDHISEFEGILLDSYGFHVYCTSIILYNYGE